MTLKLVTVEYCLGLLWEWPQESETPGAWFSSLSVISKTFPILWIPQGGRFSPDLSGFFKLLYFTPIDSAYDCLMLGRDSVIIFTIHQHFSGLNEQNRTLPTLHSSPFLFLSNTQPVQGWKKRIMSLTRISAETVPSSPFKAAKSTDLGRRTLIQYNLYY